MKVISSIINLIPRRISPNHITGFRFFLIAPIVYCIWQQLWLYFVILYFLALFSDYLDGILARERGLVTKFGSALDPVADKLLHIVVLGFLVPFAPVLIGAIILLDIIVLFGGWMVIHNFNKKNKILHIKGANIFGKVKVILQGLVIILLYCYQIFPQTLFTWPVAIILIIFTLIFSALSILDYAFALMRAK
ncbi:MAG: CDP-alcohol phosphatidyltransferase family protein [bacterium]|nr:CDP-alcohol phosphatidyltransferase family protein [bacterium]